ncbi:MAG: branched-chain amino acid ABC transporter permease [Promethearchaeota archaeon]
MVRKIRQLSLIYKKSIKNFFPLLKNGTKNIIKDIPHQLNNLKMRIFSFKGGLTILCLVFLIIFPFFPKIFPDIPKVRYYVTLIMFAMIFAIFGASWDFLTGFVGQVSFGHAIFFGMGGYAGALLLQNYGLSWFESIFAGAIVAVLIGLLIAIPTMRLRGPYLALGTQAFALITFNLMLTEDELVVFPKFTQYYYVSQYFIILAFMLVSITIMFIIVKSKMGTIFNSIRDDQVAAEASGINTTKYKLIAFMISSFFAGIAGGLYMVKLPTVSYGNFNALYSFTAIIFAAIGGIASITGAVVGSFLYWIVNEIFYDLFSNYLKIQALADYGPVLFFSLFLILVIRFSDRGIMKPIIEGLKDLWDLLLGR